MKIVLVSGIDNGVLFAAKDAYSAITYLIKHNLIDETSEIYDLENYQFILLNSKYSLDEVKKMSINEFNSTFGYSFFLTESDLISFD